MNKIVVVVCIAAINHECFDFCFLFLISWNENPQSVSMRMKRLLKVSLPFFHIEV